MGMDDFFPWFIGGLVLFFIAGLIFWPGPARGGVEAGSTHEADDGGGDSGGDGGGD